IAQNFGVSKVTVHDHIRQLERKKAVQREKHRARSLEILDPDYCDSASEVDTTSEYRLPLAILGRIAAGRPIEAIEDPETLDLADLLPMGRDHYALRVQGNSMIDDGIHDGDLVIVERRNVADDGEVVVAILEDEEATLKRLYRHTDGSGQLRFRLQPANVDMEPIIVDQVEVRGVVVGVVRICGR
ncbi:MAG: transcriptional repressor LexA, partial [Planctomycetes bacterium]|nr:transcriptional repressor LexA [Planctomycetota bacterium]